jgi:hypothetical protein
MYRYYFSHFYSLFNYIIYKKVQEREERCEWGIAGDAKNGIANS